MDAAALVDSVPVLVLESVRTDSDPVRADENRPPLSVALLNAEVEGVVATSLAAEVAVKVAVEDKITDELDLVVREDDSVSTCSEVWVREDVSLDDVNAVDVEDADALEDVLGVIIEVVNRDFDEKGGVDVAAMDEDEDLEVDVDVDAEVDLVEERDEENLDEEDADDARGSPADEVVSDPAPAFSFARLLDVTAPTKQNRQHVCTAREKRGRCSRLRLGMGLIIKRKDRKGCKERRSLNQDNGRMRPTSILASISR